MGKTSNGLERVGEVEPGGRVDWMGRKSRAARSAGMGRGGSRRAGCARGVWMGRCARGDEAGV